METPDSPSDAPPPLLDPRSGKSTGDILSVMIEVTNTVTRAIDEPSLLTAIIESMEDLQYDMFYLTRFCDDEGDGLEIIGTWLRGSKPPVPAGTRLNRTITPGIEKILLGEPLYYDDCVHDSMDERTRQMMVERMGIGSMSVIPLVHGGEVLGALSVGRTAPHVHSAEEKQLLILVSRLAAVALLGIRSRAALTRKVQLVQSLYRAGDSLSTIADEEVLFDTAAKHLVDTVGYVLSWVGLADRDRGVLARHASAGILKASERDRTYPLDAQDIPAVQALDGHPVVHRDMLDRARAEGWREAAESANLRTGVYVPFRFGGEVLGVLGVGSSDAFLTDDEVALIASFG
ncbi:MAG TPA: GAF domain-containing protein, partial [Labilithrix sp.]|nr:GAF domain-containing protein [Labilithrix sp.]